MIETELNIELHLMIDRVEEKIDHWLNPSVKNYFHIGGSKGHGFVIDRCHKNKTESWNSRKPDESIAQALAFKNKVDFFQILGVRPGLPSQKMDENTFERIKGSEKILPLVYNRS